MGITETGRHWSAGLTDVDLGETLRTIASDARAFDLADSAKVLAEAARRLGSYR